MIDRHIKKVSQAAHVALYFSGIAKIQGLPRVFLHEILVDREENAVAIVIGFDEEYVEALFFNEKFDLEQPVWRSQQSFSVAVADSIIGRVVDGLGQARDSLGPVQGKLTPIFCAAPPIIDRKPVTRPLPTGVKIIDTALSLGKGQRELIIGDRKLGKSTLAEDIILNLKGATPPLHCIYVLCGQKEQKLQELISLFERSNAFLHTAIVAATAENSFAAQYLAPFVGCAIGEYFRDRGHDALVVYDDLANHAKVYRSIALLLERAPGREAYPGDIFSLHAGLLERAAQMSTKKGNGSLTALPITETQEGDITSFISTNLVSITDGQIYLERGLFQKGFQPAVNVSLSVSRVGSKAQPKVLKKVVRGIRLALAQHKELQKLTQLETEVSEQTQTKIHRGELTLELLKQEKHTNVSWPEQVVLFYAVGEGFFDDVKKEEWHSFENMLVELMKNRYANVLERIKKEDFTEELKKQIKKIVEDSKKEFLAD